LVSKIAAIFFFFRVVFSFKIFILSEKEPMEENSVGINNDKLRNGSPIVCAFPFLKIVAPGSNSCSSSAS
jgi:hypothetical protein